MIDRIPERVRVVTLVVLVSAAFDAKLLWHFVHNMRTPLFGDFFAMWSFGRFIIEGHARSLYQMDTMAAFQHQLVPSFQGAAPFFYPPPMMFLVAPLGVLGQVGAYTVWQLAGLAAFLAAAFWHPRRPGMAALFLVLPGTMLALLFGQNGFFTGALLLGGLRLVPTRPLLGGVLLGLLIIKPQLGLLVPVALIASRHWRAALTAAATTSAIACASGLVFGFWTWSDFVYSLPAAEAQWHAGNQWQLNLKEHASFATTITASFAVLHVPWTAIRMSQFLAAVYGSLMVWRACRTGLDGYAVVVVVAACILASPHAFLYDMPALFGAMLLFLIEQPSNAAQRYAGVLLLLLPASGEVGLLPFVGPPLMVFLLLSFTQPLSQRLTCNGSGSGPLDRSSANKP